MRHRNRWRSLLVGLALIGVIPLAADAGAGEISSREALESGEARLGGGRRL